MSHNKSVLLLSSLYKSSIVTEDYQIHFLDVTELHRALHDPSCHRSYGQSGSAITVPPKNLGSVNLKCLMWHMHLETGS